MVTRTEQETASLPVVEALHDHFVSPFVQRRREMAHPVLTKGFLQLSPEAAMLFIPFGCTHPTPPVLLFLLLQNLGLKGSDITSWKLYGAYVCLLCIANRLKWCDAVVISSFTDIVRYFRKWEFQLVMSLPTTSFGDRFCVSRKGGKGGRVGTPKGCRWHDHV